MDRGLRSPLTDRMGPGRPDVPAGLIGSVGSRLQLMETFVRIVEAGNLSAAAAQMNTTQPTISRRLQALEQSLGTRLLLRSTHSMRTTVDGERCYQRAKDLLEGWTSFEAELCGGQQESAGSLRVALPHGIGQEMFLRPLAQYLRQYPRVPVEWLVQDDVRGVTAGAVDCAIQVGEPSDPDIIATRLAEVPRTLVAAPSLFARDSAIPSEPEDLTALPWLTLHQDSLDGLELTHIATKETRRIPIRPRVTTNSQAVLHHAALLGLGLWAGPAWMLSEELARGRLVQLALPWRADPLPLFLTYPRADIYPARLLRFAAMMRDVGHPW